MEMKNLHELPLFSKSVLVSEKKELPKRWTVSELTSQIRGVLEPAFSQVWVQGEVSNFRPAGSGHVYFSLKDEGSCISAAVFGWGARQKSQKPSFELKDGLKILCRGKVAIYPPRGNYQLIVDLIEPLGAGALQLAFERLKTQLASEGLFDGSRKRALPRFPSQIAVVTSPSGAAIQDMLNILKRRAPHVRVVVVPAVVQGDDAPAQLIRGLQIVNRNRLGDVVVLARGGGSIEDLWGFNSEELARAIAKSEVPVISAVGHEIDFTISDFVSDLRAPTPSAAAEIITGHWVEAGHRVQEISRRLRSALQRDLGTRRVLLSHVAARLVSPRDRVREQAQRLDELVHRLEGSIQVKLERRRGFLQQWVGKLDALSPLRVLERGYALVRNPLDGGAVVKSAQKIKPGQELEITFYDGQRAVLAI